MFYVDTKERLTQLEWTVAKLEQGNEALAKELKELKEEVYHGRKEI